MSPIIITVGSTIFKLAILGGVSYTIITGVEWFHTVKKDFKKGSKESDDHDFSDIKPRLRSTR